MNHSHSQMSHANPSDATPLPGDTADAPRRVAPASRWTWIGLGVVMGFAVAGLLPTEPALAQVVESNEKFAMVATPTITSQADAVFVLDYLTGRLVGAAYNSNLGGFSQYYFRNVAGDFNLAGGAEPQFVILPAFLNPQTRGGGPAATGGIYIGEMTSGQINVYGLAYGNAARVNPKPVEIALLDTFQFRQANNL